ncbi:hypothetical protein LSCM1_00644 [Leishmania martiniquensis]|uniref:Rab-GAP TBC domain-containing protein n=1 Tax=Leishmania martiniquensis TaxID=1580590 RepID=A0A836GT09_9TRYP|nr:hypothetical protein LSCM1_00644 [Leishmania martiniquensis]
MKGVTTATPVIATTGASATMLKASTVILPHAEEVGLRRGSSPATITFTTGRVNYGPADKGSEKKERIVSHTMDGGHNGAAKIPEPSAKQDTAHVLSRQEMKDVSEHYPIPYEHHDMFGFRVTEEEKATEDCERRSNQESRACLQKWQHIVNNWEAVAPVKLKKYCRRGIPQSLRCLVWQRLLQSRQMRDDNPGLYTRLRSQPLTSRDLEDVIERDLHRTFPTNRLFCAGESSQGQQLLRGILHAYANYNTNVGYCQGMGFIAATLILQVEEEEDVFWAFVALMEEEKYSMKGIFSPSFPQLQCMFYVFEALMQQKMPKLYDQLHNRHQVQPYFYAVHWFMTVFTYYFNFGLASRIWDMFLCEGWKPVYRVALALLKIEEQRLLSLKTETELLLALKSIQESKRPAHLLKAALRIRFKSAYVKELTAQYKAQSG